MEIDAFIKIGKINAILQVGMENIYFSKYAHNVISIRDQYENIEVKNYILKKVSCEEDRMLKALKLVSLDEKVLKKKINILSTTEHFKIELAILLIQNENCIIVPQIDKYFMEKDLLFFKKMFKKIVKNYGKTIVFIDCSLEFLFDFVDILFVRNSRNKVETFTDHDFYNERLLELLYSPKIVDFVNYVNQNGKKLNRYTDIKELIKAIYREV